MKTTSLIILCAGTMILSLTGCVQCNQPCGYGYADAYTAAPPPELWYMQPTETPHRYWYRVCHRVFNDGYSFSNDPANHDVLTPVLGIDTYFPPAPLPYKTIN